MAELGEKTTDLTLVSAIDEVVGNQIVDGIRRSRRQSISDLAQQIAATGPIATALADEAASRSAADASLDARLDTLDAANLPTRVAAAEGEISDHEARIENAESLIAIGAKTPIAVAAIATANLDIATGIVNGATIGGVVVATGDIVVLPVQTAPAQNGPYTVVAGGAASRTPGFTTSDELLGSTFSAAGSVWAVRNETAIDVGTTAIVITKSFDLPGGAEIVDARQGFPELVDNIEDIRKTTDSIGSRTVGPVPITGSVGGTALGNTNIYYWPSTLSALDEYLTSLEVGIGATGGAFDVVIAHVEGDGTLTLVSNHIIEVPAGPSSVVSGLAIFKPAGSVMGIRKSGLAGTWYYTAGTIPNSESAWYTAAVPATSTAKTIVTVNGPQWKPTFAGEIATKANTAFSTAEVVGEEITAGWPSLVDTGSNTPADYSIVMQKPAPADGYITGVGVGASAAGAAKIHVIQYNGDLTVNVISTTTVNLINGVVQIPLAIPIAAGQYPAISGGGYKFQNTVNPQGIPVWLRAGALTNGAMVSSSTQHRYEVAFEIKTGLVADVDRALAGGAQNTGMNLMADADPNGVVDATAILAAAAAAHPYPYIPPGSFAVTAIPAKGDGLTGPGKLFVGGERFYIPPRPRPINLYDGLRSFFAEHIIENNVLVLVGDSISHWAYAPSGPEHWFNRLTRFANLFIAADEPIMTALRPSSTYTPEFYGVTGSGGTTGTRGPLGESLILADGESRSFVGAYEQVDVFYTQDAGQGSLLFSYNGGAAFKTVDAAGALALDQYSGPTMTGQAASGTYTLIASGGPVEITGLVRLGVKAAGSRPRLRTHRAAHGSYVFASFNAARRASIIAQCSAFGGKPVPIYALGINDSFGTAPATIVTNANALITDFVAAGAPAQFAIPPMRPTSAWDASYTGGRTYDGAAGPLRKLYRQNSVKSFPADMVDWAGKGMFSDGLHLNGSGNDWLAQINIGAAIQETV